MAQATKFISTGTNLSICLSQIQSLKRGFVGNIN
jgi:hypothetical protein